MHKNLNAAFTVIAQNYIGFGITLAQSMKESNPDVDFYIYFADGIDEKVRALLDRYNINGIDATKTEDQVTFLDMAFQYEITEYCTAIKPFVFTQLFNQDYSTVTYIDPDIYVYRSLQDEVFSKLEVNNIVLTPHICSPINDDFLPGEQVHLKTGTYNLGFTSIKNSHVGRAIAQWWSQKCTLHCLNDSASGLFVDQKWTNLIPGLFEGVYISRHPGLNMAYWNLHERSISDQLKVNQDFELTFFHFSGFVTKDIESISKYQNRFTLTSRPDLKPLFEVYREKVMAIVAELPALPSYKYNNYSNNKTISLLARRFFLWKKNEFKNPFSSNTAEAAFLDFLAKNNVKEELTSNAVSSSNEINTHARRINALMRLALRVVGPNRYVSLCKYLGFLSSIQNHEFLISEFKNKNVINDSRSHLKR